MAYLLNHLSKQLPVVSVGSGMGVEEQLLVDNGYTVVCIDPSNARTDLYLLGKRRKRAADHANVPEYLEKNPQYDGGVQLLLHYPLPDYAMYDFLAIHDLRARFVTVAATLGGSSGSFLLHVWLRACGVRTLGKLRTEQAHIPDGQVVVSTPYTVVKHELLSHDGSIMRNADGVPQTLFVSTLLRNGPYESPEFIMSPRDQEHINLGTEHTLQGLKMNLDWVAAKRADDEVTKEHEAAVWMEGYRANPDEQDPVANALLDANVPGWRTASK